MTILELRNCTNPKAYRSVISFREYVVVFLALSIFLFGFMLNFIVLFLIVKVKVLKTIPNLFIANLALADILYLFGHVLTDIPRLFFSTFLGGSFVCKLQVLTRYVTLGGSVFTLTIMAIDRFIAIILPLTHQLFQWRSKIFAAFSIILIWIISIIISMPVVLETNIIEITLEVNTTCLHLNLCLYRGGFTSNKTKMALWVKFGVHFLLPFAIISCCYLIIALKLENPNMSGAVSTSTSRILNIRRKSSKVVIGFIITFLSCRLPEQIHIIIMNNSRYSNYYFMVVTKVIGYICPFLNPILLLLLSTQFRFLFLKLFHCDQNRWTTNVGVDVANSRVYPNNVSRRTGSLLDSEGQIHEESARCLISSVPKHQNVDLLKNRRSFQLMRGKSVLDKSEQLTLNYNRQRSLQEQIISTL